jgi:hypothetical protein
MQNHYDASIVDAEIIADPATAPKSGNWLRPSLIGLGIISFITVGVWVFISAKQDDADKVAALVRDHPILKEQLGGIDQCSYNTWASLNEGGKRTNVFDVRGPKGNGQFVTFELFYKFRSIILRTPEGEWELLGEPEPEAEPVSEAATDSAFKIEQSPATE